MQNSYSVGRNGPIISGQAYVYSNIIALCLSSLTWTGKEGTRGDLTPEQCCRGYVGIYHKDLGEQMSNASPL